MKRIENRFLCVLMLLTGSSVWVQAQMTPQEAIVQMTRGFNLGRTFELGSGEGTRTVYEFWFDDIVDAGFNFVRIPVQWGWHTGSTAPYTIDSSFLDRVEQAVDWGLERNLIVIVNSHFDDYSSTGLPKFTAIWTQVAARFQNKSDNLIFEIANEPNVGMSTVNPMNRTILDAIRVTNPTRIVMFGGSGTQLPRLYETTLLSDRPNDQYLMGTFHDYVPWAFVGEGTGTWGTAAEMQVATDLFNSAAAWSAQHNNVPVVLGEWGTRASCEVASATLYIAKYASEASRTGIAPCIWHDFGWFNRYTPTKPVGQRWNYVVPIIMANTNPAPAGIPDPMTFAMVPYATGPTSISMAATTATDASYYFTCTAGGGHDSGWQAGTTYTDTGLTPETTYTYTVKARDNATLNETAASIPLAATTTRLTTPYVLLKYEMGGTVPTSAAPGFTGGSLTKGSGLNLFEATSTMAYPSLPSLAITHVVNTPTLADALGNNSWFTFTLTVGDDINLDTLSLNAARGGSSTPRGFAVYAKVNAQAEERLQGATDCPTQRYTFTNFVIDLTGFSTLQGLAIGDVVTFKIAVYTPGTPYSIDFDNIIVEGIAPVTCQDVQALGLALAGDLSGDCYVNIDDLVLFAADWLTEVDMADFDAVASQWLDCNNPQDQNCSLN
jgi:hypothetical protein